MPTHEEKAGFAQRHEITTKQVRPIYTSGSPRLKCWIVCCSQEGSVLVFPRPWVVVLTDGILPPGCLPGVE